MLHLEVVGSPASPGPETASTVAAYLRGQGAQHIARGEVWDDCDSAGWRVTALIAARKLTACQRQLFQLGASRVVGLPARFVFDRNGHSTFDNLRATLAQTGIS
jgi:ATP phosphoribosyltransferase